jgi:hypothetical protein
LARSIEELLWEMDSIAIDGLRYARIAARNQYRRLLREREKRPDVDPVTSPAEAEMLEWVLATPASRLLILDELGLHRQSRYALGVRSPFTSRDSKPGDDGIICDVNEPQHSVALECRRVRVTTQDQREQRINKLSEVGRAYDQANGLARSGLNRAF